MVMYIVFHLMPSALALIFTTKGDFCHNVNARCCIHPLLSAHNSRSKLYSNFAIISRISWYAMLQLLASQLLSSNCTYFFPRQSLVPTEKI
jgi:hypothetical protein